MIPTALLPSPIQFRRTQDFYISSSIELGCDISLAIVTQWTIINCTLNCSNSVVLDPTVFTTFSELYIPSRTLPFGIYQLMLTVSMVAQPRQMASAFTYVQITPSGITANLVQYGTSMITRGHDQDLILNPGIHSIDLDGNMLNASVRMSHDRMNRMHNHDYLPYIGLELRVLLSDLRSLQFPERQRIVFADR